MFFPLDLFSRYFSPFTEYSSEISSRIAATPYPSPDFVAAAGPCAACGCEHSLKAGEAPQYALRLMAYLAAEKRIDFLAEEANPCCSTSYLYGQARGQMFGVLHCRDAAGQEGILLAFSAQFDGLWNVEGWVPPLLSEQSFYEITALREREIKDLGQEIAQLENGSEEQLRLKQRRKECSRSLMRDIHSAYRLAGKDAQVRPLPDVFSGTGGIPTGTGDCCAPKLLQFAALNQLTPLGLAEFYWGKENRSGTKQSGVFYPSCEGKCRPILGYMLCR